MLDKLVNSYSGKVKEVSLGKDGLKVGGAASLPFHLWEGERGERPLLGLEIVDEEPQGWSPVLEGLYQDVWADPMSWAKKCVELGAEFVCLWLTSTDPGGKNTSPEEAAGTVKAVLESIKVPLVVWGSGDEEKDPDVLRKVTGAIEKENVVLGPASEENHQLVVAPLLPTKHNVIAHSSLDINMAKQANILVTQMGLSADRVIMDPTTGALGYGLEYCFSILERLRLAALAQNDAMTQMPIICTVGREAWRVKEAKVSEKEEPTWGELKKRAVAWEVGTAIPLLLAGADMVALRHPQSLQTLKKVRENLGEQKS